MGQGMQVVGTDRWISYLSISEILCLLSLLQALETMGSQVTYSNHHGYLPVAILHPEHPLRLVDP